MNTIQAALNKVFPGIPVKAAYGQWMNQLYVEFRYKSYYVRVIPPNGRINEAFLIQYLESMRDSIMKQEINKQIPWAKLDNIGESK